jgi:hypothetical protein
MPWPAAIFYPWANAAPAAQDNANAPISACTPEKKSLRKSQMAHLREAACAYIAVIRVTGSEGKESD